METEISPNWALVLPSILSSWPKYLFWPEFLTSHPLNDAMTIVGVLRGASHLPARALQRHVPPRRVLLVQADSRIADLRRNHHHLRDYLLLDGGLERSHRQVSRLQRNRARGRASRRQFRWRFLNVVKSDFIVKCVKATFTLTSLRLLCELPRTQPASGVGPGPSTHHPRHVIRRLLLEQRVSDLANDHWLLNA